MRTRGQPVNRSQSLSAVSPKFQVAFLPSQAEAVIRLLNGKPEHAGDDEILDEVTELLQQHMRNHQTRLQALKLGK